MPFAALLAIAVALAMDAFAVALATGICLGRASATQTLRMAGAFGVFQALMPVAGWLLGFTVRGRIESFDHWLAFALLAFVGGKMLWEGLTRSGDGGEACESPDRTRGWQLMVLAVATSIDALAVGLSFAVLGQGILVPAAVIGTVCFAITAAGVKAGCLLGRSTAVGRYAEVLGGAVLLAIGFKILLEHGALAL